MKGRITPALVTPPAGESIMKLHWTEAMTCCPCGQACSPVLLWTFSAYSLMHFKGGTAPQIAPPHLLGGYGPLLNTWFLGPTRVHNPNGLPIGPAAFVGLTVVSNRQTHRPCYICSKRPRVCTWYMWIGLITLDTSTTCHIHTRQRGVVVSGIRRMNEVNARRARLVPGLVTVFGRVYHLGM